MAILVKAIIILVKLIIMMLVNALAKVIPPLVKMLVKVIEVITDVAIRLTLGLDDPGDVVLVILVVLVVIAILTRETERNDDNDVVLARMGGSDDGETDDDGSGVGTDDGWADDGGLDAVEEAVRNLRPAFARPRLPGGWGHEGDEAPRPPPSGARHVMAAPRVG